MTHGSWRIHGPTYDVRVVAADSFLARESSPQVLGSEAIEHAIEEWLSQWGCQVPLKEILLRFCAFESCGLDLMPGSALHDRARERLRSLFIGGPLAALDQQAPRTRARRRGLTLQLSVPLRPRTKEGIA